MNTATPTTDQMPAGNRLLSALGRKNRREFLAKCEPVELLHGEVLAEPGQRIRQIYFPTGCSITQIVPVDRRENFEVALVGNEGMLGISLVLGVRQYLMKAVVQGPGPALRISSGSFQRCLELAPALRLLLTRYICVLHAQLAQSAACNKFHSLDERFATFLLATQDRSIGSNFKLTQENLGQLLGVRRVGVTHAAGSLQKRKLIRYSRGLITILDRGGLEKAACSCHQTAQEAYENILS